MSEPVRLIVQMRSTVSLAASAFGGPLLGAAPPPAWAAIPGVEFDSSYSPVPIPPTGKGGAALAMGPGMAGEPTYIVRCAVEPVRLKNFLAAAKDNPQVVGIFSDTRLQPIAPTCPTGPVGTDADVEALLDVASLHARGLDGGGVRVVIVDTGVNVAYLLARGKQPAFDATLSWGPLPHSALGSMPIGHGTMCAYAACIAAPRCTLVDHALLTSNTPGGSVMDGYLSDAVKSYGILLSYMLQATSPFKGDESPRTLVVNNSWGMFHSSWDFPVGSPQNYSHNPNHPFNIVVGSLEAAGADILFAAGNCGPDCPDARCQAVTNAGITGANSHPSVLTVAGVKTDKQWVGYSTLGPGTLHPEKPDVAGYTHFAGSGVYSYDGGTSTATPVVAGVVAAIRRLYPAHVLPPAKLRHLLRTTAEQVGTGPHNRQYGWGIVDPLKLLEAVEQEVKSPPSPAAQLAATPKKKRKQKA